MTNVLQVLPKGEKAAIIHLDDGTQVWTPELEKAKGLIGQPIPADWTQKQGDYGPQAFPPRDKKGFGGGGAAAYRNSKEGQAYEQERMDRRTAAMQATVEGMFNVVAANVIYDWLRATSVGSPEKRARNEGIVPADDWGAKPGAGEGSGKAPQNTCENYADHTFKKQGAELICSKCGVKRT